MGVDFVRPLYIRGGKTEEFKTWICLYMCCMTRAVHLEIVPDMTASAFIRSLKRLSACRGLPRKFVSDNGKTFKAAAQIICIETMMQNEKVQQYLSETRVEWLFNIEKAP